MHKKLMRLSVLLTSTACLVIISLGHPPLSRSFTYIFEVLSALIALVQLTVLRMHKELVVTFHVPSTLNQKI